jgi:DNA processing protein
MDDKLLFYAALSSNDLIGPMRFERILQQCGSVEAFFNLSPEQQMACVGVSQRQKALFETMIERGKEIIRFCQQEGIEMISLEDYRYPAILRDIPDPPFLLYVKGKLLSLPLIGVVGTRNATPDALEANRYFCKEFVSCGIGIVSGLAPGHDEMAHRTALEFGGYTIAVLGTSFQQIANHRRDLFQTVCEHGAVISEYYPMATNQKWRFRFRNRLIAGLSHAVVVVQAPEKSGALITAEYALRQHRPLFFIPGNPINPSYRGSNALISKGATMAALPEDVIKAIYTEPPQKPAPKENASLALLSEEEFQFFQNLPAQFSLDSIVERGTHSLGEVITLLTQLEIKGYVLQYPGNFYEKRL